MKRPLDGVRILDFTHVLAGPFATRVLGDMGADVVKVNSESRGPANSGLSPYYQMWNRNKRALALDMSKDEAREICRRLCESADVVIDNFSVGVLDRWGVGYDVVTKANPRVIYVQMSGMGGSGPWSSFVTYAPTIHALSGLTHLTGVPGREDIGIGFSYNDHLAGLHGAVAILAALQARRQTGRGQRVDMSQYEVGVNCSGPSLLDFFANGKIAGPTGNRLPYDLAAPHGCYPCAGAKSDSVIDERWVAIACMNDAQWIALKGVMGDPPWANDSQFASADGRVEAMEQLDECIAGWTRELEATGVMERCQAAGVPAGVVQNGVDMTERDPQFAVTRFLRRLEEEDPEFGPAYADRLPIHFDETPCDEYRRTRRIGEDNAEVLADWLDMSADEVERAEGLELLR
ncbi:MAG: CoA transferase [Gammaproteobacteria bacterium]|jgi:benzylsuccinate CoA-transferase BbsF subunit